MGKAARECRRWGMVAVLAGAGVLAAACGAGSPPGPAALMAYQKALAYSQCMRARGVVGYPDPQSNGAIVTSPRDHLAQGSPQFVVAGTACRHLLPAGIPLTAAEQQKIARLMLKMAVCMRSHGITNFPDPVVNSHVVGYNPRGIDIHSPRFLAAQHVCQKHMQKAETTSLPKTGASGPQRHSWRTLS